MILYANEKLISIHNRYSILDENKELVYQIESKPISIGRKTKVYDKNNNEIIYAEQQLFHLTNHYNIYIRGNFAFEIKQLFNILKKQFVISNGYYVEGNFLSLDFNVYNSSHEVVAEVSRKFLSIGDKYRINIINDNELEVVLSIIVVITNIIDNSEDAYVNP